MEAVAEKASREEAKLEEVLEPVETPRPLEWVPLVASLGVERKRVKLRSGEERVYESYRVRIPKEVVEKLGLRGEATLLLQVARPRWYHLLDYREEPLRSKFMLIRKPWIKAEICLLGHAPEELCRDYRTITVIASEEELRKLGLEPGQPIALRELLERARSLRDS